MYAARDGAPDAARALAKARRRSERRGSRRHDARSSAPSSTAHYDTAAVLLEEGANPNIADTAGWRRCTRPST